MNKKPFLNILENNKVAVFFVKANNFLYFKYSDSFKNNLDKEKILTSLWSKEYKADLIKTKGIFTKVSFRSELDLSMFMIKFFSY